MKNKDAEYEGGVHRSKSGARVNKNSDLKRDAFNDKIKANNTLAESGERNDSKNTKALGADGTGQNNDSIWERSDDSEKVYKIMGSRTETLGEGKKTELGHIPWSGRIQSYDLNSSREKERAYGFFRKISEGRIKEKDSIGRTISQQVQYYFADTVLKTEDKLIFTDGNYKKPKVNNIVEFESLNAEEIEYGKEIIWNEAENGKNCEECCEIAQVMLEKGVITSTNSYTSRTYGEGDNYQRKGTDGKTADKGTRKSVSGTRVDSSSLTSRLLEENARLRDNIEDLYVQMNQAEGKLNTRAVNDVAKSLKDAIKKAIRHLQKE